MIAKCFSTIVLFLLPLLAHAQTNPVPGYIISNQGDTIRGVINYRSSEKNGQSCMFMPTNATQSAKAMIVPVTKYIESNGMSFEFEDYGAAVENMLLAIADLGYASVWMDGQVKMGDHREQLAKLLNVPDDMTVRAVLPIGKPSKEIPMRGRKPFEERVVFNRF